MTQFFQIEDLPNGVRVLTFNRPDLESNILSAKVLQELDKHLDAAAQNKGLKGLVFISGKDNQFIAGADISEIETFKTAQEAEHGARQMQLIFCKIAALKIPTLAAIHGACLGGGLEMSLACKFRVASDSESTVLGLPEIQLGLLPGAGGTQRLPRLVGLQAGLDMILTGKRVPAQKALKMGLVDAVVHVNLLKKFATEFFDKKPSRTSKPKPFMQKLLENNPVGRSVMKQKARQMVEKNTKGFYPAAFKALEAVFKSAETKMDDGLKIEAKFFGELSATKQSKSLIHLFHATTQLKKHPYKDAGQQRFGKEKVSQIGVIGAGFMGAGIAIVSADKGIRALLSDPNKDSLAKALQSVSKFFSKKVKQKRLKPFQANQKFSLVSPGLDPRGFGRADVVIEAVFEDLNLKQKLLTQLQTNVHKDWIFASNTSAIPIGKIAEVAKEPERVLGMHFFSPVEKMPLLEIIVTDKTAPWATARAIELGQTMGKQVIVVKDGPGFYTTRALAFFLNEAALILCEGAKIDKIDKALMDFGFPVGPITLIDEVGIDVGKHVLATMQAAFRERIPVPDGVDVVLKTGRLGRKNGKGFYKYENDKKLGPDPEIYDLLAKFKQAPRGIPSDEIVDRCLLSFVNESIHCLESGILRNAFDGDVGAVFGLGFPPFWGGPFHYVDQLGADVIYNRLLSLTEKMGPRFTPANLLKQYAQEKKKFFPASDKTISLN